MDTTNFTTQSFEINVLPIIKKNKKKIIRMSICQLYVVKDIVI